MPAPPSDMVDGPRKRRPTERVTDNGDPLVLKKAKTASIAKTTVQATKTTTTATTFSRRASIEDVAEPTAAPRPQPHHPSRILEATDGSDDDDDDDTRGMPELEDVEADEEDSEDKSEDDEPEDDEAELGKSTYTICQNIQLISHFIARLMKRWDAPVYAFFRPTPAIVYIEGRKVHVFECAASHCKCKTRFIRRYIDTGDISSTSNLRRHAIRCWGDEAVQAADKTTSAKTAQDALSNKEPNGSITAAFERVSKGGVTYSHRQHTKAEARYIPSPSNTKLLVANVFKSSRVEFVRWVTENKRPFQIVNDPAFRSLMKTGRPETYIPSAETHSRDVKNVFVGVRKRISDMLKVSFNMCQCSEILTYVSEIRREVELRHRCVDVAQSQGLHGNYGAFRARRETYGNAS